MNHENKSKRGGPSVTESTRRGQMELLAAALGDRGSANVVIVGDFNTGGDNSEENRK